MKGVGGRRREGEKGGRERRRCNECGSLRLPTAVRVRRGKARRVSNQSDCVHLAPQSAACLCKCHTILFGPYSVLLIVGRSRKKGGGAVGLYSHPKQLGVGV